MEHTENQTATAATETAAADAAADAATATDTGRAAQDLEMRAKRATARAKIAEYIEKNLTRLPKEFVASVRLLVNLDSRKAANSLYTRVLTFLSGKEVEGVDHNIFPPPNKGDEVDDYVLYKAFKVAETDMNKVIYQGQDNGIWIAARKVGRDIFYWFFGEGKKMPKDYPGPIRRPRTKKDEESATPETNGEDNGDNGDNGDGTEGSEE